MEASKSKEYEQGWNDAFDVIADYVEEEICMITGSMIRRMRYEEWRYNNTKNEVEEED
jgi:hypothetical protein